MASFGARGLRGGLSIVSLCYVTQPDWLAPVTLVPPWYWVLVGSLLAVWGYSSEHKRRVLAVLALWGAFAVFFVEESHGLVRAMRPMATNRQEAREQGLGIRVSRSTAAWGRARALRRSPRGTRTSCCCKNHPDGMTFSNCRASCSEPTVRRCAAVMYRFSSVDGSNPSTWTLASHFVHATVELPNGFEVNVISLRLSPPVFRLDFWTPGFWREHRDNRVKHRKQISRDLAAHRRTADGRNTGLSAATSICRPTIAHLNPLLSKLTDAFDHAGRGWGPTGTNTYPLFRVDQVWVSQAFHIESVRAQKTLHSDHRMVVCDLAIEE